MPKNTNAELLAEFCRQPTRAAERAWLLANWRWACHQPLLRILVRRMNESLKPKP